MNLKNEFLLIIVTELYNRCFSSCVMSPASGLTLLWLWDFQHQMADYVGQDKSALVQSLSLFVWRSAFYSPSYSHTIAYLGLHCPRKIKMPRFHNKKPQRSMKYQNSHWKYGLIMPTHHLLHNILIINGVSENWVFKRVC